MSDIFISYASSDRPRVKPLVAALELRGWKVWWDRTILPGKTWDQVIEEALAQARCVIVLWSRDSVQSRWVRTEAHEADRRGILVPALLDQVDIPLAFKGIQAANLVGWSGAPNAELNELVQAVSEVLSNATPFQEVRKERVELEALKNAKGENRLLRLLRIARTGFSRRTLAIIGIPLLSCIVGLVWYVVSYRQFQQKTPDPSPKADTNSAPTKAPDVSVIRLEYQKVENSDELPALRAFVSSYKGKPYGQTLVGLIEARINRIEQPAPASAEIAPQSRKPGDVAFNLKDGLKYRWIPPSSPEGFIMGCSPGDSECLDDEKPPHTVRIANGFWLGETEVTQAAWKKVNGGDNPSHSKGDRLPVENVDWNQAKGYCEAIGGRLPTEQEWEYAARAGTTGPRYGSLDAVAWYSGNSGAKTHPVGMKQANAFGLHDMLGNVWQWTSSDYDAQHNKVVRGGSWGNDSWYVRASYRLRVEPAGWGDYFGFRCVGEFR